MKRIRRAAQGALKSRFLKESTTLQMASLVTAGSNLIGSVVLAATLGARELSVFYLAVSVYALFWSFLNLGLAPVATMRIAGALRSGDKKQLEATIGLFFRLSVALAIVAVVLATVSRWFVPEGFAERIFDYSGSRILLYASLLGIVPLFEAPRNLCVAALQGQRRMSALARIEVGQELCRVVCVIAGALVTWSALGPTIGFLAGNFCGCVLSLDAYRRERRSPGSILPPLGRAFMTRGASAGSALREGVKVGLVRNVDSLGVETIPTLLVGVFGNQVWATYLKIAQRFGGMLRVLMMGINRTALPALSELAHVKDVAGLRRAYWKASALSGITVCFGLALLLPVLPYVIGRLYSPDFHGPVFTLVLILSPGIAVASFAVANDVFYLVTQQMRTAIILSFLGFVFSTTAVFLCVVAMPKHGGAVGLSIACLWALVHMTYAGSWLHRHGRGQDVAAPEPKPAV